MSDPVYLIIIKNDLSETIGRESVSLKPFKSAGAPVVGEPRPPPTLEHSLSKRGKGEIPSNPLAAPALIPFEFIDSAILANIDAHLAVTTTINTGPRALSEKAPKVDYLELAPPAGASGTIGNRLSQYLRLRFDEVNSVPLETLLKHRKRRLDFVYNSRPTADEIYRAFQIAIQHSDTFITAVMDIGAEVQINALFAISQVFEEIYVFAPIVIAQGGTFFYLVARRPKTPARGYPKDTLVPFFESGSMYYTFDQRARFYLYLQDNTQDIYLASDYLTDYDYWKLPALFAIPSHSLKQPVLRLTGGCGQEERGERGRGGERGGRGGERGGRGGGERGGRGGGERGGRGGGERGGRGGERGGRRGERGGRGGERGGRGGERGGRGGERGGRGGERGGRSRGDRGRGERFSPRRDGEFPGPRFRPRGTGEQRYRD